MGKLQLNLSNKEAFDTLLNALEPIVSEGKRSYILFSVYSINTEFNSYVALSRKWALMKYKRTVLSKIQSELWIFMREIAKNKKFSCSQHLDLFRLLPYTEDQLDAIVKILIDSGYIEIRKRRSISSHKRRVNSYLLTRKAARLLCK